LFSAEIDVALSRHSKNSFAVSEVTFNPFTLCPSDSKQRLLRNAAHALAKSSGFPEVPALLFVFFPEEDPAKESLRNFSRFKYSRRDANAAISTPINIPLRFAAEDPFEDANWPILCRTLAKFFISEIASTIRGMQALLLS
jgi:hypothetical protein